MINMDSWWKNEQKTSSSQILWRPFFCHNKTTGCPTWYWKWVLPFWVLVPLANVGPVPKCFQDAMKCFARPSSFGFTTLINERSSFITSCAILRKSKLCSTKVTTKHWSHTTPTSVISIKTSFNSGTLDNLRNGKKTTKKHHLWIKWVNWSILRLTLSIDSFHFSLYKSFVTPLSFPTYLTAQQEAYHIQPPEVLPRTLVLVPCEKASHGFFHSGSGYKVYIPMYICNTIYNLYIYSLFHTQYLGFRLS